MSFQDAPVQKTALQSDTFRTFVLPIIFFGGLAVFIWSVAQYLWHSAEEGATTVRTVVKTPVEAAPARTRPARASAEDQSSADDEDEGSGIISINSISDNKTKVVREWKMRGVIYDLITLKPIPGVTIIFTDYTTNSRARILTDIQGRYRIILPPLAGRGYLVTLAKTGYEKSYLNPGTEGVGDMPLDRRKEIVRDLSKAIADPASLEPNSEDPLRTDFHMAPTP